jgi:hypothetical protein
MRAVDAQELLEPAHDQAEALAGGEDGVDAVAVDAVDRNACELFEIGLMGPGAERVAVVGLPCNALACSTKRPLLGAVTGVSMELCSRTHTACRPCPCRSTSGA